MEANTPQLWDNVWKQTLPPVEDVFALANEENSIRWQRIERIVLREFGSFRNLNVIEIGAGAGTNAALMARRGAQITVLDYSESALRRSQEFFRHNGVSADFIQQDALSLPPELQDRFDISMSFGLTEHFKGSERVAINKAHFDLLRKGGISFISVPNKYNLPYRIWKVVAHLRKTWTVGEEYPYSRREFRHICRLVGVDEYSFFGDSLAWSLNFISPFRFRKVRRLFRLQDGMDISKIKREKGTPLDAYLAYALVLCGKK